MAFDREDLHGEELSHALEEFDKVTFNGTCGIVCVEADGEHAISTMTINSKILQPFGFVHGGATLALLEAVASRATDLRADLAVERPFGINVNVWHKNPGIEGTLTGYAVLDREEPSKSGHGRKQFWNVRAEDDHGTIVSEGVVITKIVSKEYLAQKQAARQGS